MSLIAPNLSFANTNDKSKVNPEAFNLLADYEFEEYTMTSFYSGRKPSPLLANVLLFCLFLIIGIGFGYQSFITLKLQAQGASYLDQSHFSLSMLPFTFKVFTASFLDVYYIKKIGKCKTWICSSLFLVTIVLAYYSIHANTAVHPDSILKLTVTWTIINSLVTFFQIAGETWIVKLFDSQDEQGAAASLTSIGREIGKFLGYNVFVPLNDQDWLNTYIFTRTPTTRALMTDQELIMLLALMTGLFFVVTFFFVAEKQTERDGGSAPLKSHMKMIVNLFCIKSTQKLILWLFVTQLFVYFVRDSLTLKLLDNGISTTFVVNSITAAFIPTILSLYIIMRLSRKGILLRMSHIVNVFNVVSAVAYFLVFLDLEKNRDLERSKLFFIFTTILDKATWSGPNLAMAYVNTVTSHEMGSTFITLVNGVSNLSYSGPTAIGLKIISMNIIPYNLFATAALGMQLLALAATYHMPTALDKLDREDYDCIDYRVPSLYGSPLANANMADYHPRYSQILKSWATEYIQGQPDR